MAAKLPSVQRPGFVQLKPAAAVIVQVVPEATLLASLAQFVPVQVSTPVAIVGTVHAARASSGKQINTTWFFVGCMHYLHSVHAKLPPKALGPQNKSIQKTIIISNYKINHPPKTMILILFIVIIRGIPYQIITHPEPIPATK